MEHSTFFIEDDSTTPINDTKSFSNQAQRFGILSPHQFYKLQHILLTPVSIGGTDPRFPTLVIKPFELIQKIKRILKRNHVPVRAVKMNGSTAGYVLQDPVQSEKKRENTCENYQLVAESQSILPQAEISPRETIENCDSNSESSTSPGSYLSESETDFASGTDSGSDNSEPELTQNFSELNTDDSNNNNNSTYNAKSFTPTDLDIIFEVDLNSYIDYQSVKSAVLRAIYEFYPPQSKTDSLTLSSIEAHYIPRKKKIWQDQGTGDKWSLLSLHNAEGKNIDLKFISRLKRSFEFSVDSFQIYLDVLCDYLSEEYTHSLSESENEPTIPLGIQVTVETKFSNLHEALNHLNNKIIDTVKPEEIRGGGLLKYCYLLIHSFETVSIEKRKSLEGYMCSRFFIDFHIRSPDYEQKILSYLSVHFPGASYPQTAEGYLEVVKVINFLRTLQDVAERAAICLGKEDLNLALMTIDEISKRYTQPQYVTYSFVPYFAFLPPFPTKSNTFSNEDSVTKSKVYVEDTKRKSYSSTEIIDESKHLKAKSNTQDFVTREKSFEKKKIERPIPIETQIFERRKSVETTKFNSKLSHGSDRFEPQNLKKGLEQGVNCILNAPPFCYNFMPIFAYPNLRPLMYPPTMLYNQTQQQNMIYTQTDQPI